MTNAHITTDLSKELSMDVERLTKELAKQSAALLKEQERIKELEYSSEDKEDAIKLHDTVCRFNHTDGCGWFYDIKDGVHNWSGFEHKVNLEKVAKIRKLFPELVIENFIKALAIANAHY